MCTTNQAVCETHCLYVRCVSRVTFIRAIENDDLFEKFRSQCRFVVHGFKIPFGQYNFRNAKISDLMRIEGACHHEIFESPLNI